ncbi:MAG: 3-deoxy-D-manno-octulosonic acid transferase [Wenzhouxiangellaceae bacterium]
MRLPIELMPAGETVPGDEWDILAVMSSFWLPVYRLAASALAPLALQRLATPAGRRGERRGDVPEGSGELWLHAASVGEFNAVAGLLERLLDNRPGLHIVVSTTTQTAAQAFEHRFGNQSGAEGRIRHVFAPLDTTAAVRRWLKRTAPSALVLVETEIWPVMLDQCRRRSIPVAIVNARLSERAMRRYRCFAGLFRQALAEVDPVLCQDDESRERFEELGIAHDRVAVTGNLKFDLASPADPTDEVLSWQRLWSGRPVWVAASTHAGEERIVADAHRRLLREHADALLLVVPRHPERGEAAFDELKQAGLTACMVRDWPDRAACGDGGRPGRIQAIVVDRMGVLTGLYRLVDACMVCGSLVEGIGGHNLIEPALTGKPILTGIHTAEQQAAADGLEAAHGLVRVQSAIDLAERLAKIFEDPEFARQLAENASAFVESQRGALHRTIEVLEPWLDERANVPRD